MSTRADAKVWGYDPADLPRVEAWCHTHHAPTPAEIEQRAAEVRAGWDERTRLSRLGIDAIRIRRGGEFDHLPARNPMAGGIPSSVARRNGRVMRRRVS
jgi:hypothetical protein